MQLVPLLDSSAVLQRFDYHLGNPFLSKPKWPRIYAVELLIRRDEALPRTPVPLP
jgi:hypothetical protein